MSGVDTVRGIAFQQAHGVLEAISMLEDPLLGSIRVEGLDDVVDVELFTRDGRLHRAIQVKIRTSGYTWGQAELLNVFTRWAALPGAQHATFEFLTDGRLGPTGELVEKALRSTAAGDPANLVALLGPHAPDATVVSALGRARVRQDPRGTKTVLAEAERQVSAMLPTVRSRSALREQAERAVDRLFRHMLAAAGEHDPEQRLLTRQDIAQLLGVPADQSAAQRWPGTVMPRYLHALSGLQPRQVLAELKLRPVGLSSLQGSPSSVGPDEEDMSALTRGPGPMILAGRSGSGKTTAASLLRALSVRTGYPVIVAHAESYVPGRLAALVADALGAILEQDLPSATGAQALADPAVTVVVDGVSEVTPSLREGLAEELRAPVASGHGARLVLVGRDASVIGSVLPSSVTPHTYELSPLSHSQKIELATSATAGSSATAQAIVAVIGEVLGEAVDNPLLFAMSLEVRSELAGTTGRADVYRTFLSRLARRTGAAGLGSLVPVLGIAYARLLDDGRRFADIYEWLEILADASGPLNALGLQTTAAELHDAARRCGLISLTGWEQTVVPLHDSFADYLAGDAHARGRAPLPQTLFPGDEQRLLFSVEIGGVTDKIAQIVARDLPFTTVALSRYDRRLADDDTPHEVASLLAHLRLGHGGVMLARLADGRVMALPSSSDASRWIDAKDAIRLSRTSVASTVLDADTGPTRIAVRLWRQHLLSLLTAPAGIRPDQPRTQADAVLLLTEHARRTATATRELVAAATPPGHEALLAAHTGPGGMNAVVGERESDPFGGTEWGVTYTRSDEITVVSTQQTTSPLDTTTGGSAGLRALLDRSPQQAAAAYVRTAIHSLTNQKWLIP
ncbi:ATP-binding protein [Streptomyces sp. NPDC046716]|uniref:NACHT domain-containing protein n=1 Tax=Streptomyces sp. NPDC046716 TaxID=3157093 RepID=UPI0033C4F6EE